MTAVEIAHPNGQRQKMICRRPNETTIKRNPNAAKEEFKLLQMPNTSGLATPKPYHIDESTSTLVIEYIVGDMLFSPIDLDDYLIQLANQLVHIHSTDHTTHDLSFLPESSNDCPEITRARTKTVDQS